MQQASGLPPDFFNRARGNVRRNRGLNQERSWCFTKSKTGSHAVCEAVLLTKIHVEPACECAAENAIRDNEWIVVRGLTRHADVAYTYFRLHRSSAMHEVHVTA